MNDGRETAPVRPSEETLDPEDWESARALGHRMLDEMVDHLRGRRDAPIWRRVPEEVRARLRSPLPLEPRPQEEVFETFRRDVLPYPLGNTHPRFWGWVIGSGTATGMLAALAEAAINTPAGGYDQASTYVERQLLDWLKEAMGFPADASGLLVSGGSMANLVGITVARSARAGFDIRKDGVRGFRGEPVLYASAETHSSIAKGVELLGLGNQALHRIPVDASYRIDLRALEAAIASDRAAGRHPLALVGNAGTVNTGAIDDLEALAAIARREGIWFHVDGAFGAIAALAPELRPALKGMEQADSLAFDLHKWLHAQYDAGCVLVRREEDHRAAFGGMPHYLAGSERGIVGQVRWFNEYGVDLSRRFRALGPWMAFQVHGLAKFGRLARQNVEQARTLARLVEASPDLELMAPAPLNVVCFRFTGGRPDAPDLDAVNLETMLRLQEQGIAIPSSTLLNGRFVLRVAITNHRTRTEDVELLARETVRIGSEIRGHNTH